MYKIEKGRHGFTLTFSGTIYADELQGWLQESAKVLAQHKGPFGVIVDMRSLLPLGPEARAIILQGQRLFKNRGLERSVVVLTSSAVTAQFRQLAKDSGVYRFERYINASDDPHWLEHALDWVQLQIDPDQIPEPNSQR
jgi:anti-anti-sigma regulatory factor